MRTETATCRMFRDRWIPRERRNYNHHHSRPRASYRCHPPIRVDLEELRKKAEEEKKAAGEGGEGGEDGGEGDQNR